MSRKFVEMDQFRDDIAAYGWLEVLKRLTNLTKAIDNFKTNQGVTGAGIPMQKKAYDFCPIHGGKKGDKFVLFGDAEETGNGYCFKCDQAVSGFDNIMLSQGVDFPECCDLIREIIYDDSDRDYTPIKKAPRPAIPTELTDAQKAAKAKVGKKYNEVWNGSVEIDHPIAEPARQYFARRKLLNVYGQLGGQVRFHPSLNYFIPIDDPEGMDDDELEEWENLVDYCRNNHHFVRFYERNGVITGADMGNHPTLTLMMRDPDTHDAVAMHRIYLDHNGSKIEFDGQEFGKVKLTAKKRMQAIPHVNSRGSCVLIDPAGTPVVGVAEGLETALAVKSAIGMPMHCTVDAGGLANYKVTKGTHTVVIFEDKDASKTGEVMAEKLQERLEAQGVNVIVQTPTLRLEPGAKSVDWQDVVQQLGVSGFFPQVRDWMALV